MQKWKHTYTCKEARSIYPATLSLKLKVGSEMYGAYEEHTPETKFRALRDLVLNKHALISAFYEECDIYTRIASLSPTPENISKVKELSDAILLKRKGF